MWELERSKEPSLRWVCATCHRPSVEHLRPWWACTGHWLSLDWEARLRHERRVAYIIGALFGGAH